MSGQPLSIAQMIGRLIDACVDDENPGECQRCADELVRLDKKAVPHLLRLLDSPWADVRLNAVEILGRIGDPAATTALTALVEVDPDSDVQGFAAQALARLRGTDPTKSLIRALKSKDGGKRTDAVLALARLRATSALPQLAELASQLADTNAPVAGLVSAVIIYIERGIAGLERVLQDRGASPQLRHGAAATLGSTGQTSAVCALLIALRDEDESQRSYALQALGGLLLELQPHSPKLRQETATVLSEMITSDPSPRCRTMAVESLGKVADETAIPLLELVRKAEPEPMVRRAADRALKSLRRRK